MQPLHWRIKQIINSQSEKMKLKSLFVALLATLILTSCGSTKLETYSVAYQSVRPVDYKSEIPDDATIIVAYAFSNDGNLTVAVKNNTDEIMIIDQTKSFLVNSDGQSISYYDPTVRVQSSTSIASNTSGGSVNLGAVAGALGVGGRLGALASGINVGGSSTDGFSTTNTTYFADQPQISLGPKGNGLMSKTYGIKYLGKSTLSSSSERNGQYSSKDSYCKFSVCITYSIDGGETFERIVTDFYANSLIICPVRNHGKVNEALHTVLSSKTDALGEPWWMLYFKTSINNNNDIFNNGVIIDYK